MPKYQKAEKPRRIKAKDKKVKKMLRGALDAQRANCHIGNMDVQ